MEPINAVEAVKLLSLEVYRQQVALQRLAAVLSELARKAGVEVVNG